VFASRKASTIAADILEQRGCKVFRADDTEGRLDLEEVLKVLAGEGITRLMVEGGPTVAAAFVAADLVDEAVLLHANKIVGPDGIDALEGMKLEALTQHLRSTGREQVGPDALESFERS
jgi:diaminohydroxyphosphoribosylaminopyrimidine deaminase/5-amino-6-(5-phosphoribosylamino)uracil reductase